MRAPPTFFRRALKLAGKGLLGATGLSTAATVYVYTTDESWRRCIDFNINITPLCWDYYKAFRQTEPGDPTRKVRLETLHEKHAPLLLNHVLNLGGYYVKCAQMFWDEIQFCYDT